MHNIIIPETEVVDSEIILSGNVLVKSIHPRPAIPSAGDLQSKQGSVSNVEREKDSWSWLRLLAWLLQADLLLLLCRGSSGSVVRLSD